MPRRFARAWRAEQIARLHATTVAESLLACDFDIRAQIIWAKERLALGRGHYHWQHEPCWYAVRDGATRHWAGDRKQTTLWQIPHRDQDAETVHGTQKPVACMRRPIENNSSPGQAVFEPFSGSGTTLIAAEMAVRARHYGRSARAGPGTHSRSRRHAPLVQCLRADGMLSLVPEWPDDTRACFGEACGATELVQAWRVGPGQELQFAALRQRSAGQQPRAGLARDQQRVRRAGRG